MRLTAAISTQTATLAEAATEFPYPMIHSHALSCNQAVMQGHLAQQGGVAQQTTMVVHRCQQPPAPAPSPEFVAQLSPGLLVSSACQNSATRRARGSGEPWALDPGNCCAQEARQMNCR